jgi:hypothetical protein
MCLQDHSGFHRTCATHESHHAATPARKPTLTRMPKIEYLNTTRRIVRPLPAVSLLTQTSPSEESTDYQRPTTPTLDARSASATSNSPQCPHRRSHAIVQGRFIPFCLRCGDPNKSDGVPFSSSGLNAGLAMHVAVGARPLLCTMQGFPFDMRRSRVEASRLIE